jgi:hypothetical protein
LPLNLSQGLAPEIGPILYLSIPSLVEANNRKCPTCNLRLRSVPVSLICQCCRAHYHKQARFSGLTKGALDVWKKSKRWECTSCIDNQAQEAVNDPEVNPVSSQEYGSGVRCGLRVLQRNVDGIGTSMVDVILLVMEGPGLDVLLLQETKLSPANPTPTLHGYFAIRCDRPPDGGRGGRYPDLCQSGHSFLPDPSISWGGGLGG